MHNVELPLIDVGLKEASLLAVRARRALEGYAANGLEENVPKRQWFPRVLRAWGAETEEQPAISGPVRGRLLRLMILCLYVACMSVTSLVSLESLLGQLSFTMLFRRPLFAVLFHVFREAGVPGKPSAPFRLRFLENPFALRRCVKDSMRKRGLERHGQNMPPDSHVEPWMVCRWQGRAEQSHATGAERLTALRP